MSRPSQADLVEALLRDFAGRQPFRAGSFIVTVYGDAVAPRGGRLSLASLLALMAEVGANESLVRTAVSRLSADGWLSGERRGRRSFYRLTDSGSRRFEEATRRIYFGPPTEWDGAWQVVLIPGGAGAAREVLRKELRWLGFGQAAPGVLIHPMPDRDALAALLSSPEAADTAILVSGGPDAAPSGKAVELLVAEGWTLEALAEGYRRFLERFAPLAESLASRLELDPLQCLLLRLLLIHEYRKVILRDPMLPLDLLPRAWPGQEAQQLCRGIYAAVVGGAEAWVSETLRRDDGALPPPGPDFWARFGGLPQKARAAAG